MSDSLVTTALYLIGMIAGLWILATLLARHLQRLALLLTGSAGTAGAVYDLLALPGVVLHELAHLVLATVLGVRVIRVDLFRFRRRDDMRQGEVVVQRVDPFRMSLIGAAPLFAGVAVVLLLVRWLALPSLDVSMDAVTTLWSTARQPRNLPALYLLWAVANTMFPSAADRAAWWTIGSICLLIALALVVTGQRPTIPPALAETLQATGARLWVGLMPVLLLNAMLLLLVVLLEQVTSQLTGRRLVRR